MKSVGALVFVVWVVSCATARPGGAALPAPAHRVSAQVLLHEYWSYAKESEAKYRGTVLEVSGLVEKAWEPEPGRSAVDLQVGERSYFVRCWLTPEAANQARGVAHDQLVVVRGLAGGPVRDDPWLDACAVAWSGGGLAEPRRMEESEARRVALSTARCRAEERARTVDTLIAGNPAVASQLVLFATRVARFRRQAERELEAFHLQPLECAHPLIPVVDRCSSGWNGLLGGRPAPIVEGMQMFLGEPPTPDEVRRAAGECATADLEHIDELLAIHLDRADSVTDLWSDAGVSDAGK